MTTSQYDFSKKTNYLERQMFLDPAGQVTVQRFEQVAYPKLQKYEEVARGFFWQPEEIDLTKDKSDRKNSSDTVNHIFTENLLRQTSLDALLGKVPSQIFTPVVSVPEAEALMYCWSFYETNIHSKSYSHIIRNIYNMPTEQFNSIHDNTRLIKMAANIGVHFQHLHELNCKKELGIPVSEYEHCKAIWMALHTSYAVESLRFMVSFATSLAMVENKIFIGNGNIISLILQDESLHADWTAYIINQIVKDDPRFRQLKEDCEAEVYQLYLDVIKEEKDWAEYLFEKGVVVGLNTEILNEFMDYNATYRLKDIGIKYLENPVKVTPIPWFNKHSDTSKKQAALQESESVSYIIGAMSDNLDLDSLPDI